MANKRKSKKGSNSKESAHYSGNFIRCIAKRGRWRGKPKGVSAKPKERYKNTKNKDKYLTSDDWFAILKKKFPKRDRSGKIVIETKPVSDVKK